jgi:CRP/FNR family transcriptional regulator, anaerobic regulatory protein
MIRLPNLSQALQDQIRNNSALVEIPAETEILREGQYVKVIPLVIEGLVKVFTKYEDKELLLYYIQANESCVMSFTASLKNEPSKVYAITDENCKLLLLPVDKVAQWIGEFPDLNNFDKMDKRLLDYLKEKVALTKKNPLKISHRQIASELGTAREVISRVMKKLEQEAKVKQLSTTIEIL